MTATSKLDGLMQDGTKRGSQSGLAQDVAAMTHSKLSSPSMLAAMGLSGSDMEFAQKQKDHTSMQFAQEFTQQEMAEAVARRQGADATAYQRLFQFAFNYREPC